MTHQWEQIGEVDVDAGLIWIGDPCYVMGEDASSKVHDWSKFVDLLYQNGIDQKEYAQPLEHKGAGIAVQTQHGDGTYPVYAEFTSRRAIKRVMIDFDPTRDEDEG